MTSVNFSPGKIFPILIKLSVLNDKNDESNSESLHSLH